LREHLSSDDLAELEKLVSHTETFTDRERLVARGDLCDHSQILIEGLVLRCMTENDRRYVVGMHVPGDFVDLHSFPLKRLDHDIYTIGRTQVGYVPHDKLETLIAKKPSLARVLWFATLLDAAIHRKWILMLEQLNAAQRIAHVYCELRYRLQLIGREVRHVLRTPLTQQDLAEMCGVTPVHVNRAVRKLKQEGLAEVRRGDVYTKDWDALCAFAGFTPDYLYAEPPLQLTSV
jgi:CRP-like cAMP-binding protein